MTQQELNLWIRIQNFQLDDPESSFQFSQRLARENGWSKEYTRRVMEEYKRFLFLCCISEEGITPSDPVDQAWHLHLTYTRSYWLDLCQLTLQKDIHHNPTKGGNSEKKKFNEFYDRTNSVYFEKFGQKAPADIWHPSSIRFSEINFQRVNLHRFWLIPKPSLRTKKKLSLTGICFIGILYIQAKSPEGKLFAWIFAAFLIILFFKLIKGWKGGGRNQGGGCGSTGCSGCSDHGHSGCGSSGCSGCGD